jgi:DNA-binding MarR family transcriptional regulator
VREIADGTGLSKSAVQMALETLRRRELIESASAHATAVRRHRVLRPWRRRFVRRAFSKSGRLFSTRRS